MTCILLEYISLSDFCVFWNIRGTIFQELLKVCKEPFFVPDHYLVL